MTTALSNGIGCPLYSRPANVPLGNATTCHTERRKTWVWLKGEGFRQFQRWQKYVAPVTRDYISIIKNSIVHWDFSVISVDERVRAA